MNVVYRDGTAADLPAVDQLFRTSFADTFGHLYSTEDLATFLAQFTPEAWLNEYRNGHAFRLAEIDGALVGFLKLGPLMLPVKPDGHALELRQIYILKEYQGAGIAQSLMGWALDEARRRRAQELYLTVYTDNPRARRVYERYGFEVVGPYAFMVGNQADEDIIMRKRL
jgi:ribosomal protein S18 acetylase RimI-like enzyme